jgi:hypothetical protein
MSYDIPGREGEAVLMTVHADGGVQLAGYAPSARAMTICWTSSVPSPIVRILASR